VVVFRRRIVFPLEEVSVVFGFLIIFYVSLLLQQRFEFLTNIEKDLGFKFPLHNVTINVWTMTTGKTQHMFPRDFLHKFCQHKERDLGFKAPPHNVCTTKGKLHTANVESHKFG
jgi:hypothetical protein